MKKTLILLLLSFQFSFAQEVKVDGNLKVMGKIDAQNQPITNVGTPVNLDDAVSARVLQESLRDDDTGPYEYKFVFVWYLYGIANSTHWSSNNQVYSTRYKLEGDVAFPNNDFTSYMATLSGDGWKILDRTIIMDQLTGSDGSSNFGTGPAFLYELRRQIEDE